VRSRSLVSMDDAVRPFADYLARCLLECEFLSMRLIGPAGTAGLNRRLLRVKRRPHELRACYERRARAASHP
jgi:hypothetical protein